NALQRVCTAIEVEFYLRSFAEGNGFKPNKNCNLSGWPEGCEPGWACALPEDRVIDLSESKEIPLRTDKPLPCCEGFFCPRGLTCMIPCPLGAYCPFAKPNTTTGLCDPYGYQFPPGKATNSCGGADKWLDVGSSGNVFCSAGSYCPTTTVKTPCSSGHYCRLGSTSEKSCFKLTSCDPNSANQNIHAYGIMLFAALSTLLLIIYNCSDQVITVRERRNAKSRETAARSARETAQARERWKAAKEIAKKHALGLQTQLSRTFSRKRSVKQEELKMLPHFKPPSDASPTYGPPASSSSGHSEASTSRKKEPSALTKMMHTLEDDPNSIEGFNLEIGDKHLKKMEKPKKMSTRSQIFNYAYGQIEKEKAMQQQRKNLTFSGIIAMATDSEIRTRPPIEIAFKDLTLTLKGKKKNLLRCVTGKIMPGHITALMGPSGAGKTTFLNAIAGKATGCTITGVILVNGRMDSIHSYKKIIGFVPQDDIVHGNLTVEENLWFSARCRLPAHLPKADKVLVVERVIESLGLQPVRDSLVGTVEKRGISGGQRKRVNVGLEMVMEPSLLILDEPTSGLDSASSQLLLRALRREALEGVNVCMVVHQPSVPERVNPPDHFIDILEGIVKPSPNSGLDYKQLPVRWMLHNGYPIPPDMESRIPGVNTSSHGGASSSEAHARDAGTDTQSFAGEFWEDVKSTMQLSGDKIQHNFLIAKDLSNRQTPGILQQYKYFVGRVGKQRLQEARIQAVDFLILLLAGACLGTLAKVNDATFGAAALLCKIAALRSFSLDKLQYWRESASGISSLAYFLSKDTVDLFSVIVKPVVYLSMFYFFSNPRSSFLDNYIVLLVLVYCVTGIAYVFAVVLEPAPAQLWSVLLPVVLTLIATQRDSSGLVKVIAKLCYPKWALEAFVIANAKRYSGVWLITRCGSLLKFGYDLRNWPLCIAILVLHGMVTRILAYVLMVTFQKK
ncbi:ABC transporter G family member 28, partial [Nymphaea thermarum]